MAQTRYEITMDYPVRAKKGERKGSTWPGCLRKNIIGHAPNGYEEARLEVKKFRRTINYGKLVEIRYYNDDMFRRDPLNTQPYIVQSA